MRTSEWVLAALAVFGAVALLAGWRRRAGLAWGFCVASITVLALHQGQEGMHWQLIPLYLALALVGWMLCRPWGPAWLGGVGTLVLVGASLGFSWVLPMFRLPAPTGPYAVGTRTFHLKDAARARELVMQAWYPAEAVGAKARYVRAREIRLSGRYQAQIRTNSYQDAPIAKAGGTFPVVIFGHKWGGRRTQDTFLAEDLASHGYVVASVDHPGNSSFVEMEDGTVVEGTMTGAIDMVRKPADVLASWNTELTVWTTDNEFALNALATMSAEGSSWAAGRLDTTQVAAVGHSFGGAASMRLLGTDPRVKCAVNLDGWTFEGLKTRTNQPVLYLYGSQSAERDPYPERPPTGNTNDDQLDRLDRSLVDGSLAKFGGYKGYLRGAEHSDFTDETLLSPLKRLTYGGTIGGKRAREITRGVVLGFLDQVLKGTGQGVPEFGEIRWVVGK